eukprot:TRINITY_DN25377_c0_g1_i1.p1 TRINITY_DN25377_c0_g1~~TRINITY_DN25377_c0_g1_i1.p1  ORF type:complete len:201 (+),score=31.43 TRINITY_DN25377_c0_g1_i1:232-834(+)
MELAIGFSLLTCFSVVVPSMSLPGLVAGIIEYRLLAFRMTTVTQRPSPCGAEGIGVWRYVFDFIGKLAVLVNVGTIVFLESPMSMWRTKNQLLTFIVLEHVMLMLQQFIQYFIQDMQGSTRRIAEKNSTFVATLRWTGTAQARALEEGGRQDQPLHNEMDLGLCPPDALARREPKSPMMLCACDDEETAETSESSSEDML